MTATLSCRSTVVPPKRASIAEAAFTYVPEYLDDASAQPLFDWLLANAAWQVERLRMFGRSIEVPRLVAWYGDPGVSYRYSSADHVGAGWPRPLTNLLDRVRAEIAPGTNFVLVNRYRSGVDSMGWHTDDEPELIDPVVSITLGATRRFHLRTARHEPTITLHPAHGSLLIHDRHSPHCVPKTRVPMGERVNLSFRTVVPR